jgi:hypothetical protein
VEGNGLTQFEGKTFMYVLQFSTREIIFVMLYVHFLTCVFKNHRCPSEHIRKAPKSFARPEPACGISIGVVKKAVRDWTNRNHKKHWESTTGLKQAKGLILGPSARRTKDLVKLNRNQLRWVVVLFTGHCHLKEKMDQPHTSYVIMRL